MLLGGAMQPNLAGDGRPAGPQMLSTSGGARAVAPFAGAATPVSTGPLPDYVTGTDAKKALARAAEPTAAEPTEIAREDASQPVEQGDPSLSVEETRVGDQAARDDETPAPVG
ncbi:MAG TPA: hypothetical protein VGH86_03435 [Phenylobacterium sp.]|jgi:hypothetical protein